MYCVHVLYAYVGLLCTIFSFINLIAPALAVSLQPTNCYMTICLQLSARLPVF